MSGITYVVRSRALKNAYCDLSPEELIRVCADLRDAAAWSEFICRFHAAIYSAVLRTGRRYAQFHRGLCDDLVQDTYLRLAARDARALRDFVPRREGSAQCYLRVIAARVTQDFCKKNDFKYIQELPPDPPDIPVPAEAEWLALKAQIGAGLRKLATPRDCRIFRLHYLCGLTSAEIAAIPDIGLSLKGVESVLVRLKRSVQEILGGGKRE